MPLAAELDGQRVISLLMTDEEWAHARTITKAEEQRLLIGFSHLPGFARVSSGGLRHFAHRQGYKPDYEWEETIQHLTLKAELMRRIADTGWQVDTEVPNGPDRAWIADILATNGNRTIAFEVQWSYQAAEKYIYRQQRYAQDGIECVWIVRREPDMTDLDEQQRNDFNTIPIFPLADADGITKSIEDGLITTNPIQVTIDTTRNDISLGAKTYTLTDMVQAVLNDDIKSHTYFNLDMYETPCEHCHKPIIMWDLDSPLAGNQARPEEAEAVVKHVTHTRQLLHINAPIAGIAFRKSGTLPDGYKSFICPHCNRPQGAYLEHESKQLAFQHARAVTIRIPLDPQTAPFATQWDLPTYADITYKR